MKEQLIVRIPGSTIDDEAPMLLHHRKVGPLLWAPFDSGGVYSMGPYLVYGTYR